VSDPERINGRGRDLLDGLLAGAAGSTALNAVSYLDMAVRARPASRTPEETIRRLADLTHLPGLGAADTGEGANRRSALGPLLGYLTGMATAVAFAVASSRRRMPVPMAAVLLGAGAMLTADAPMTALGVTDPRRWDRADWIADVVPHLAYGAVAALTWRALRETRCRKRVP
jgi:hypothetical protein